MSVTLVLDRELDISRGDLIVSSQNPATVTKGLKAALVWMDQKPLERNHRYLLKHTSQTARAVVTSIEHRTDIGTLAHQPAESLEMNGIGVVTLQLLRPIAVDLYGKNRSTGAFILMDPQSNATVAAGMIIATSNEGGRRSGAAVDGPVTANERATRWGHRGALLELSGPEELIDKIERSLFQQGMITSRIDTRSELFRLHPALLESIVKLKIESGFLALIAAANNSGKLTVRAETHQISVAVNEPDHAIQAVHKLLVRAGIVKTSESVDWEI